MSNRLTTEEFIKRANEVHNNKYNYSKVKYINNKTKVEIICPIHGSFWQRPDAHLRSDGCPKCKFDKIKKIHKLSQDDFIKKASEIHNNKYNYSKIEYIDWKTKVIIICPKHGEFKQRPNKHLQGQGCPKCSNNIRMDKLFFIKKANVIHNNKYDYSKVHYINSKIKIEINCLIHGSFFQRPNDHLQGHGCPVCGNNRKNKNRKIGKLKFIDKANKVHNNKYNYDNVEYVNNRTKVAIICPKHGEFEQRPYNHLKGEGCPVCKYKVSKQENEIAEFIKNNITDNIIRNSRKIISPYELDIYLPEYKIAIEFNGKYWHSSKFKDFYYHQMKFNLCKEKKIYLIHIFEEDYKKYKDDIFEEIKCCCRRIKKES